MFKMLFSVIISFLMVAVLFLIVYISKRNETDGQIEYRVAYGDKGLEMLIACVALIWLNLLKIKRRVDF